jgi:enhancing lycopene biosynthesis protein 2
MFRRLSTSLVTASKRTNKHTFNPSTFVGVQQQQIAFTKQQRFYATSASTGAAGQDSRPSVAVILHGAGYLDGTEITEAVSVLVHLSRAGFRVLTFSPDGNQEQTWDHNTKTLEKNEIRNVLAESTRISRVPVRKMNTLKAEAFQALIIPGGYGVAKNLSNYAEDPQNFKIEAETERAIKEFIDQKKPIGAICVAPILLAKLLGTAKGGPGVQLTVGRDDKDVMDAVTALGATAVPLDTDAVQVDDANLIVTTPAYMAKNPQPHEVYDAIGQLVEEVKKLVNRSTGEEGEGEEGGDNLLEELNEKIHGKDKWQKMKQLGFMEEESTSNQSKHAKPSGYADDALADFKTIKRVQA